jgi:hypothetical protein
VPAAETAFPSPSADAAADAIEQLGVVARLERRDRGRGGGLRDAKLQGCTRHVPAIRDGDENP